MREKKTTKNVVNIVEQLALLRMELLRSSRLAERAFKMSTTTQRSERFVNKFLVKEKMLQGGNTSQLCCLQKLSKTKIMLAVWGDRYFCTGPCLSESNESA